MIAFFKGSDADPFSMLSSRGEPRASLRNFMVIMFGAPMMSFLNMRLRGHPRIP